MYTNLQVFVGPDREIRGRGMQPGLNSRVIWPRNIRKQPKYFKGGAAASPGGKDRGSGFPGDTVVAAQESTEGLKDFPQG